MSRSPVRVRLAEKARPRVAQGIWSDVGVKLTKPLAEAKGLDIFGVPKDKKAEELMRKELRKLREARKKVEQKCREAERKAKKMAG